MMAGNDKQPKTGENSKPTSESNAGVLDLDLEHAGKIVKVHSSSLKGRKKYTKSEDMSIVTYIVTNKQHNNVNGKMLWTDMVFLKITDHTWESMKCRYLKTILPSIDNYDIPNSWKSLLTGDISKAITDKSTSKPLPQTTISSPKKRGNSNLGLFGNHPPQLKKKKLSNIENVTQKNSNVSPKKLSSPNCSAISSSTVTPSPPRSPLTNPTSTPKHKDGCSNFVNIAVNLEEQIDEYDSREISEDILESNKTVHTTKADLGCSFSSESESEDEFDKRLMKLSGEIKSAKTVTEISEAKSPEVLVSNKMTLNTNSSVECTENDGAVANVISETDETVQNQSCLKDQENSLGMSEMTDPEDEFDKRLMKLSGEIKSAKTVTENSETKSPEVPVSNKMTFNANSSVECTKNDGAVANVTSKTDETVQNQSCLRDQENSLGMSELIGSDDEFDLHLIERATESDTCSEKSKRKNIYLKQKTSQRHTKGSSLRNFVASDIHEISVLENEDNDKSLISDDLSKVIEEFQDQYKLSKLQIISVLWNFNGNVKNCKQWIEFGSYLSNLHPWSKGDDSLLTSTNETNLKYLKLKYTAKHIAERNLFFEYLNL